MMSFRIHTSQIFRRTIAAFVLVTVFYRCPAPAQSPDDTPPNFKIAFIGDQGLGPDAQAVLQLIKNEGAQAVLHDGDFDYMDDPQAWDDQINAVLGEDYPYFAAVGNHDQQEFYRAGGYQDKMEERMNRLGIAWEGDWGVRSSFHFGGIYFVLTAPGIFDDDVDDYGQYIRDRLVQDNSIWSISAWHKVMRLMQVGEEDDDAGWGVYEESRKGGAIIATAHVHFYCRTHLLSSMINQTIADTSSTLVLTKDDTSTIDDEGKSFVFVSGLGGDSINRQRRFDDDWWAGIYTRTQNANYGALFGVFNLDGTPNLAKFYFKDIDGVVPDSFLVVSEVEDFPTPVELAAFAAEVVQNTVTLTWTTTANNLGFEIERKSPELDRWQRVGLVRSTGATITPMQYEFRDAALPVGAYNYRLKQIDMDGSFVYSSTIRVEIGLPTEFALYQNYPNPFNPNTTVVFSLPNTQFTTLRIITALGNEIAILISEELPPGIHRVDWDAPNELASGIYYVRMEAGKFTQTRKLVLLR